MNLTGKEIFDVEVEAVWRALHDPEILTRAIPGCQSLTLNENGEYDVVLKLGIAAVKGEYVGKVKIEDVKEPVYYILYAEGSGSPGHVKIEMDCEFSETDVGCQLDWKCHADIGGKIASVGSRVLGGISKFMAKNFFKDLKKQLKQA